MIAYLQGQVKQLNEKSLTLLVGGVGYKVAVTGTFLSKLKIGENIELEVVTVVKEDAIDLYGFSSLHDKRMFQLLTTISGVGPKSALNVLNTASAEEITEAVINQEPAILQTVSGIGIKTAERIVLELKNKITKGIETTVSAGGAQVDVFAALQSLGYQLAEIRTALKSVDNRLTLEEKIKLALKNLSR